MLSTARWQGLQSCVTIALDKLNAWKQDPARRNLSLDERLRVRRTRWRASIRPQCFGFRSASSAARLLLRMRATCFKPKPRFSNCWRSVWRPPPLCSPFSRGTGSSASILCSPDWDGRLCPLARRPDPNGQNRSAKASSRLTSGARSTMPRTTSRQIEARSLRLRDCDPDRWDSFAQRCDASYRSAHHWLRAWSRKGFLRHEMKLFELFRAGRKIGQCAVGIGAREGLFLDRLQLDPLCRELWADAMAAVLAELGPRRYVYGWDLNFEASREDDLRTIAGVTVETVCPLTVHAVDFAQWASWSEYWKSTSSNTQRNAKRPKKRERRSRCPSGHRILVARSGHHAAALGDV